MATLACACAALCASWTEAIPAAGQPQPGSVQVVLRTVGSAGTIFQVANARVRFAGPTTTTAGADAANQFLIADLAPGTYSAQLLDGWQLFKGAGAQMEPVSARLVSQNPVPVTIVAGQTTNVLFRFDLSGEVIPFGAGRARIGIEVTEPSPAGSGTGPTGPATTTLQNDSFVHGGQAGFQGGFVAGECAASILGTAQPGQVRVSRVEVVVGGAAGTPILTVGVRSLAATGEPGDAVFEGMFPVTASDAGVLNVLDLSANNVLVSSPFAVSICFSHSGLPGVARDSDGTITSDKNWVRAPGWMRSSAVGLTGDWIIRAVVAQ